MEGTCTHTCTQWAAVRERETRYQLHILIDNTHTLYIAYLMNGYCYCILKEKRRSKRDKDNAEVAVSKNNHQKITIIFFVTIYPLSLSACLYLSLSLYLPLSASITAAHSVIGYCIMTINETVLLTRLRHEGSYINLLQSVDKCVCAESD